MSRLMWTFYIGISFANEVNFSGLKGWTKISEGKYIDKQIEIGVHQRI